MKPRVILFVTNDDVSSDLAARFCARHADLLIARESLAAAVLFVNRNITLVLLAEPNSNLARLLKKLRPDVKILAIGNSSAAPHPEYIDACFDPSAQPEGIDLILQNVA